MNNTVIVAREPKFITELSMPHITALFTESDQTLVTFLREHKTTIRETLAPLLGYDLTEVAFIARPISTFHAQLSDNLDRLEFVIDTGGKTKLNERKIVDLQVQLLKRCPDLRTIEFGIYVRVLSDSGYSKYVPPLDDD